MAKRLFNLRNVPDDEATQVRQLLDDQGIEYYETPARFWVFSMPAIWLIRDSDFEAASASIQRYQVQRQQQQRELYRQAKEQGRAPTLWRKFLQAPVQFILTLLAIAVVLYLSLKPFMS